MRVSNFTKTLVTTVLVLTLGFGSGTWASRHLQLPTWPIDLFQTQDASANAQEGDSTAPGEASTAQQHAALSGEAAYSAWDPELDSNYYRILGPAVTSDPPAEGTVRYGELDALGRATGAVAVVTQKAMEDGIARERENTSNIEPSGWGHNQEVDIAMPDGTVYHGLLFNRSHLVAKSLGGDEDIRNLITATRTQNVGANVNGSEGGMAYAEGLARSWLQDHPDGTVYYAATPVYEGNELLARSVLVDIRTSDGSIDQRIEVFNAVRGFDIDYATGTFVRTEEAQAAAAEIRGDTVEGVPSEGVQDGESGSEGDGNASAVPVAGSPQSEDGERKVIVTGSGKAYHHDTTCEGLTHARSMEWVTVSEAESMGRHPCGICGG